MNKNEQQSVLLAFIQERKKCRVQLFVTFLRSFSPPKTLYIFFLVTFLPWALGVVGADGGIVWAVLGAASTFTVSAGSDVIVIIHVEELHTEDAQLLAFVQSRGGGELVGLADIVAPLLT